MTHPASAAGEPAATGTAPEAGLAPAGRSPASGAERVRMVARGVATADCGQNQCRFGSLEGQELRIVADWAFIGMPSGRLRQQISANTA